MPKVMITNDYDMPFYYNVSFAVGSGSVNQKVDVMLVQYFLSSIAQIYTWGKYFKAPAVSGKMDQATVSAIKGFQKAYNSSYGKNALLQNGVVSPAKRESDRFTIYALNHIFNFFYSEVFMDPWGEGSMPQELRNAMYQVCYAGQSVTIAT